MNPDMSYGAPRQDSAATETTTKLPRTNVTDTTAHGADLALAGLPWFVATAWEDAIRVEARKPGNVFAADDVQIRHNLPDAGNGTGGAFRRAHHAGVIRRVGYRPSHKGSRAGSVVALWTGCPEAGEAA